jgi:NAD(P)-dependent dehydrogenase (short-subunit alcohol dehydrogenase family)
MTTFDFSARSVLITGASQGIGLGIARAFAAAGATLSLVAQDETMPEVAATLGARGYVADIGDATAMAAILHEHGPVDVLVNNAGLERLTPIAAQDEQTVALFEQVIHTNIVGTYHVTRLVLPHMGEGGCIINTASIWGRVAEPLFGAYVASKHAIIGLTKTWAKELGTRGIRVNAVAPGWVRTEASLRSLAVMAERSGRDEVELMQAVLDGQALSGFMDPDDVSETYLFLASPFAASITGQTLGVDRGEHPF